MEGHASRTQQTLPVAVQEKHQPKAELLTRTLQSALEQRFAGDTLTATAQVRHQGKQTGVYDIEIVNQQQKTVALFRGKSHRIGGTITGEA